MSKEHDKIGTRLALILTKLNSGERLSVADLAEEFAVSIRTIQKDLNERLSYIPLKKEQGHYLLESYCLGKLNYNDIRHFATFSGIRELYPQLSDSLIVDLLNQKTSQSIQVKGHRYEDLADRVEDFNRVALAIVTTTLLHFDYKHKPRVLRPYRLVNTNGIWYAVGTEDGKLKNFSFSKMTDINNTTHTFVPDKDIATIVNDDNSLWYTQQKTAVTLSVEHSVAEYFLRRALLPHQETIEQTESHLILRTQIAYEDELFRTVRYWIPHIRILEPADLQQKLEITLKKYLNP